MVDTTEFGLCFNPGPLARANFTDSERVGSRVHVFTLPLTLCGKHVPGDTRFWFARECDRAAFAELWRALGWTVVY